MSQIHQKPSSIKHRLKSWKIEHNFKRNQLYFNHVSNWKLWLKFFKFGLWLARTILLVQSILQIAYLGLSPPNIILILLWERKFFKISILKNYSLMKTLNLLAISPINILFAHMDIAPFCLGWFTKCFMYTV